VKNNYRRFFLPDYFYFSFMILIADSGSTKTDWRLIDGQEKIRQMSTAGINPYFQSTEEIAASAIKGGLLPSFDAEKLDAAAVKEIFFYGAGCGAEAKKKTVEEALRSSFSKAQIVVETDMLGAARALCGKEPGIAAILGTGMNTCYYDGVNIIDNKPSLGYVLGDEGSGAHIGKAFIQAFLNKELPEAISKRFTERFSLSKEEILDHVYRQPYPNRFLASFSKFIYQNLKEQYIIDLVASCFHLFFEKHVCRYEKHKELQLSCTGSVAFYYSNILRAVAAEKGIALRTIVENPIAGLTLYHLGE
jgi:N-acetylglucosamine kinase-like BadF-type ATPase